MENPDIKKEFLDMTTNYGILQFFKSPVSLKSGRQSTVFFNAGNADSGKVVNLFGKIYAAMIKPDMGGREIVCLGRAPREPYAL